MPQGLDPSVPLGVQVPTMPNPLTTLGSMATIQNNLNANDLFQQSFEARKALGGVMQKNINPETGELDYPGAMRDIGKTPAAAFMAPEIAAKALEAQKAQQGLLMDRMKNEAAMQQRVVQQYAPLVAMGDGVKYSDVMSAAGELTAQAKAAGFDDFASKVVIPHLIELAKLGDGPALAQALKQQQAQALSGAERINAMMGVQPVHAGDRTVLQQTNQIGGTTAPIGSVPHGMTPGEAATPIQAGVVPETGAPLITLKGNAAKVFNAGGAAPGTQPPAGAPGLPRGVLAGGIGPEREAQAQHLGVVSADYEKNLNERVTEGNALMLRIEKQRELMKEIRTGGGATAYKKLAELAQGVGVPEKVVDRISAGVADPNSKDALAAAQIFEKYAVQGGAEALRAALANGTRPALLEFTTFQKANPNLNTDPRAIEQMYNYSAKVAKIASEEQTAMKMAQKNPGFRPSEWPAQWQRHLQDEGIIKMEQSTGKAKGTQPKSGEKPPLESFFK
jgi:hypothetical protein